MIEKIIDAMMNMDYKTLASYFSEDGEYIDYCPLMNGKTNHFLYGNSCVEMFFRRAFASGDFVIASPLIESENRASFFGAYSGPYVYARLNIEEYDSTGLIKKIVVHPA